MGYFRITADSFEAIGGKQDDPQDYCLHGRVIVQIGDTILEDSGTVSATALVLLKTLTEDKIMSEYDIQMIPCCGHFLAAENALTNVTTIGCNAGTDWSTIHEGGNARLALPSGLETIIPLAVYLQEVLRFADMVEGFYNACSPKILPDDEFHRNGYLTFWKEWHRRYNEAVHADGIL